MIIDSEFRTYHNVGWFDFLILWLAGTAHGLPDFHRASYFPVDAEVKEDECDVRKEFCQQGFGDEVVVHNVIVVRPERSG